MARELITSRGGRPAFLGYDGYPGTLCTSVNHQVIHGIPGNYKLKNGDIISLDLGIELNGYFSDQALTLPIGTVSPDAEKLMRVTSECLYHGIDAAVEGNRVKDISRAVYSHAAAHGLGVVRDFCGHGVGLAIHEEPQIPNYVGPGPNPRLKSGMVVAIEPMINLGSDAVHVLEDGWTVETSDHSLSAHFEHTVVILKGKTEILTLPD
jgi:methionyl aminopeptidase